MSIAHDLTLSYPTQVRDVRIISDRNSRRCKGIAYIEFFEEDSVAPALKLSGTKIMGIPIQVQHTQVRIYTSLTLLGYSHITYAKSTMWNLLFNL